MDSYEVLLKDIDSKSAAIVRHLSSKYCLDQSFRAYLESERSALQQKKEEILAKCSLVLNAPQGDTEMPETLETLSNEYSPAKPVANVFSKKNPSLRTGSPSSKRYQPAGEPFQRSNKKKLSTGRMQVYQDQVFETCSSEKNPFFETLTTQTDEEGEANPEKSAKGSNLEFFSRQGAQQELINSIGGINPRNISYVMEAFNKRPCHRSKISNFY